MLYSIPFIAGMAVLSAMLNSAIAVMLVACVSYTVTLIGLYIASTAFDEPVMFFYLLPSGIKKDLVSMHNTDLFMAIASTPLYTLILALIAWFIFKRRNL
jgi:hypothetical protein